MRESRLLRPCMTEILRPRECRARVFNDLQGQGCAIETPGIRSRVIGAFSFWVIKHKLVAAYGIGAPVGIVPGRLSYKAHRVGAIIEKSYLFGEEGVHSLEVSSGKLLGRRRSLHSAACRQNE